MPRPSSTTSKTHLLTLQLPHRALSSSKTPLEALPLYHTMLQSGLKPDHMTYPFVIKACNESSVTWFGLLVHTHVVKSGFECDSYIVDSLIHLYANGKDLDVVSWNAMIDGYVKHVEMGHARMVFDRMVCRDVISWNTMINGYAIVGKIDEAKRPLMKCPREIGILEFHVGGFVKCGMWRTLLGCSMRCLVGIIEVNSIVGTALVDMYAKCGKFPCHASFNAMESKDVLAWNTIIASMAIHGNVKEAQQLFKEMKEAIHGNFELGEMVENASSIFTMPRWRYILLSNIYAAKKWDDARKVRNLMKVNGISKVPGVSVIELKGMVHRFVAGDWSHPESNKIYEKLNEIHTRLKSAIGYSADTGNVLLDMEEEDKEHALAVHSEKSAIAYGLLHLDSKEAIRIVKNLRVCEIVTMSSSRFQRFMVEKLL
ncbi:hypothetical protein AAG906_019918 [Vitis piasezkii]